PGPHRGPRTNHRNPTESTPPMTDHDHDETPIEPEGWQGVTDDALAAWAIDRIAEKQAEKRRIERNAQAYIDQIQADALADTAPLEDSIAWLEGEVRRYYE